MKRMPKVLKRSNDLGKHFIYKLVIRLCLSIADYDIMNADLKSKEMSGEYKNRKMR